MLASFIRTFGLTTAFDVTTAFEHGGMLPGVPIAAEPRPADTNASAMEPPR